MRSEIIILLVFASLTQGSYAPTLEITYHGLSDKQMAVLNKIIVNQEAATSTNYKGMKFFFATLCDVKPKAKVEDSAFSRVVDKVEDAIDISFDSLLIALAKSCSVVGSAQKAAHDYVYDAAVRFAMSIESARSGNHYKNRDAIKTNQIEVKKAFANEVKGFYNAFYTCLHTTDAEVLAVIKDAHKGSLYGLVHLANVSFNAIRVKAAAFASRFDKSACMYHMQKFRNEALVGVSDNIEYKFTLLKTYFISSHINPGGILSELFSNQYALTVSYRGYKAGNTVIFDRIIEYLRRIYLKLSDNGNIDYSEDNLAVNTTLTFYNYANGANFASISVLHPDATRAIATAEETVATAVAGLTQDYFDAIHVALAKGGNYSYVTNYIAASKDTAATLAPRWVQEYVRVIRLNRIYNPEIEAEFARLVKFMNDVSVYYTDSVLNAIGILAEAMHANEVRPDDFSRVRDLLDASNLGCGLFTQGVSATSFIDLVANDDS